VNDSLTTPYFSFEGKRGKEAAEGMTAMLVLCSQGARFVSNGPSLALVEILAIDTYQEADYLAAKRLALSGTCGWHLESCEHVGHCEGGCDAGR